MEIVLQKLIANSGLMSRRQAESAIRQGQVKVNNQLASLGQKADPQNDQVTINNRLVTTANQKKIYLKLNKPVGYTCTNRVFPDEKNVFDLIETSERLFTVGRLDKNSCGLLILTNDGDLANRLSHPRYEHEKIYEVKLDSTPSNPNQILATLRQGVDIGEGDGIVKAKKVKYLQNNVFIITLSEGKKRQVRRMFWTLEHNITSLKRINFAGLELGNLAEGKSRNLSNEELAILNK